MQICGFTKPELDFLRENCNYTWTQRRSRKNRGYNADMWLYKART
nr:MAG TPA: hypothetical protein [Caudoviricetes sp.]